MQVSSQVIDIVFQGPQQKGCRKYKVRVVVGWAEIKE